MKKYIGIALAVLMVVGLATVALGNWPNETFVSGTTTNWNGSGHVWGGSNVAGAGVSTFDTDGAFVSGYYTGRTYAGNSPQGFTPAVPPPLIASSIHAYVTDGHIWHDQLRTGPDPLYSYVPAPGGEYSYSRIEAWQGQGELAMTTYTNEAWLPQEDNNLGGPKCSLGSHYAAQLVADVDISTGYYEMNRYIEASDGDNIDIFAQGAGHAYMESLSTNMSTGQVTNNNLWPTDYHAFNATTGPGNFALEGSGTNRVTKHLGFSTSGPTGWTAIDGSDATGFYNNGDGITQGSAFLGIYSTWTNGFNISSCEMTAN